MPRVRVEQTDPPTATPILAEAIVKIGEAAGELSRSGLNEKAIIILLQAKTKLAARDIKAVLDGLKQLRAWYCKK